MNKQEIIHKIKSIEGLSQTERAYLIELVNTKKRYGLVWEDKPEDVEQKLYESLPVLQEVKGKEILYGSNFPNHILIESDNLIALTSLSFTHAGKIDAMYFDPPYNTGAKDWRYNNDYVEKEDAFKHSKWLSMMEKRLKIAKGLLKEDGIICVTIDDYEMPRLFILMEEIFGEENHLGTIVIRNNPSGRSTVKGVSITHEYGLFFGKSSISQVGRLDRNEKQKDRYDLFDDLSSFEWVNFRKHGGTKKESPSMFYPIYISENSIRIPEIEWSDENKEWIPLEEPTSAEKIVFPIDENGLERRWKWGIDRLKNNPSEFCVKKDRTGQLAVYVKARMNDIGVLPLTWWDKKEYSATAYGTNFLKEIFSELQIFSYPKSIHAVIDSLRVLSNKKNAIILDIFGGSGTTMHAVMQLNNEDGGNRQCILVTNNENNICEEVTYERNKRVINGYTNTKGIKIQGLSNNNLRYYKTEFVSSVKSEVNKRLLTQSSTDLLCIKEDCYTDITDANGFNKKQCSILTNDTGKYLIIVYHSRQQLQVCEQLVDYIKTLKDISEKIRLYAFSPEKETLSEDFIEVADKIDAVPLPEAIYNAYRATFRAIKLDKKQPVSKTISASEQELESPLFNPNQIEA